MVRHQAIRINVKGQFRFLALEQAQKLEMVIGRLEYPLAIIPTRDQVVKPTSYFDSRLPCHGGPRNIRGPCQISIFQALPLFALNEPLTMSQSSRAVSKNTSPSGSQRSSVYTNRRDS